VVAIHIKKNYFIKYLTQNNNLLNIKENQNVLKIKKYLGLKNY